MTHREIQGQKRAGGEETMQVIDFTHDHIPEAIELARANYEEERRWVDILPPIEALPALSVFADIGLGAAALVRGKLVGFLGFYRPRENVFTSAARGTFSPIHGHGAVPKNRREIYQRLYQRAAAKLADRGIATHSIGLYAHDRQAIEAFYTYGFGLQVMDAMRPMEEIPCSPVTGYTFYELSPNEKNRLLPLKNLLREHLGQSPCFLRFPPQTEEELEEEFAHRAPRYFCASRGNDLIAFLEVSDDWENFASADASVKNICGASCLPEHRGGGLYQKLLDHTIAVLKAEGYPRLGVDFESANPTAAGFWLKYFQAYTHGVVRRVGEKALGST